MLSSYLATGQAEISGEDGLNLAQTEASGELNSVETNDDSGQDTEAAEQTKRGIGPVSKGRGPPL